MFSPEHFLHRLEELYPDTMVLEKMDEFERGKLAGKVELIKEVRELLEGNEDGK